MNSRGCASASASRCRRCFSGFAVRGVHWAEAAAALRGANYLWVVSMLPVTVWTLIIRAQRWRVFLQAVGVPPLRPLVSATNIGFMANMILPLRIGEVIRPVLLSRRAKLPLSGVLASVLLERIFDMFTILFLFGVSASIVTVSDQVRQWGWMLSALALAVAAVIVLIRLQERLALRIARALANLLPGNVGDQAYGFAEGFVRALEMLDSPTAYVRAFAWSLYLWLAISVIYVLRLLGVPHGRARAARRVGADDAGGDRRVGSLGPGVHRRLSNSAASSGCASSASTTARRWPSP